MTSTTRVAMGRAIGIRWMTVLCSLTFGGSLACTRKSESNPKPPELIPSARAATDPDPMGSPAAKPLAKSTTANVVEGDGKWGGPPGRPPLPLQPVGPNLVAYNPHQPSTTFVQGSGHTHCAPDHSGMSAAEQEERLANLPPGLAQDFVWMTCHNFVAPDPGVPSIEHMYGVEIYLERQDNGISPHMLALLPDGRLADEEDAPFGIYEYDVQEAAREIERQGGLSVLAHPSRYTPTANEIVETDDSLWGMEALSGSTNPAENLKHIDARLSAGQYTCLSAGGDIHAEDYKLTLGYQVVGVSRSSATRDEIFRQVANCNFFACGTKSVRAEPMATPRLTVINNEIEFASESELSVIRFVGAEGKTMRTVRDESSGSYAPRGHEKYIRVEAVTRDEASRCYSQPIWLLTH